MKKKKWPRILLVLLVAAAAAAYFVPKYLQPQEQTALLSGMAQHTVGRGDVSVTVTGSGKLEMADTLEIALPTGIEVQDVFVETGDYCAEGEILASLDVDSLSERAAALSAELSALDMQLMARRTVSEIASPVKGRIVQIFADENDDVIETINEHGALALISTDGLMQVEIETSEKLAMNAEVDVKWNGGTEEGTVAGKTQGGYVITFADEDAPYQAEADVYYNVEKIGSGVVEIHEPLAIFGNGGTIEEIRKEVGDQISAGTKLFSLVNEPAADSYRQTLASRNDKAEQMQTVLALLSEPYVKAEEAGLVQMIGIEEGKTTGSAAAGSEMTAFVLGTGGAVSMTADIDELDIRKIAVGQEAQITLDAISGETFRAEVSRISYAGQTAGSITTYAVELTLDADERLLQGMNGSAVIRTETAEDVLIVPVKAISEDGEGEYVMLLNADGTQTKKYIETGLSNGTDAQVTGGLSQGDTIVYRASTNMLLQMQQRMMENQAAMFGGVQE